MENRLLWIDWMKAIGMVLIAYGHLRSIAYVFVYTFSVPLFFLISGFLSKKECSRSIFWKKLTYNMIIPLILLSVSNFIIDLIVTQDWNLHRFTDFLFGLTFGFYGGVHTLWFVYSLILLKFIFQYLPDKKWIHCVLLVAFPLIGLVINHLKPNVVQNTCAIINVCMAYPFFCMGYFMKKYKQQLNASLSILKGALLFVLFLLITIGCSWTNGAVWMYIDGYGKNLILFILGGLSGSGMVYIVSKFLGNMNTNAIRVISNGTILILAFHEWFLRIFRMYFTQISVLDLFFSILVVIGFIPIIKFSQNHLPYLIGKYRVNNV